MVYLGLVLAESTEPAGDRRESLSNQLVGLQYFFDCIFDDKQTQIQDAGDLVCACLLIGLAAPIALCFALILAVLGWIRATTAYIIKSQNYDAMRRIFNEFAVRVRFSR